MTRAESFRAFLGCFSEESFPITLSDDNIPYFSSKNVALPPDLIRRFILQGEKSEEIDEYTEYIACCIIPDTGDIHAVVYWKGGLLQYEFVLITYDKNGVVLHRKVIAGVKSDGVDIVRSIATIDEDWIVHIVVGHQSGDDEHYNPSNSQSMTMELMINGEILFQVDHNT